MERCLSRISEAAVKLGIEADEVAPGPQWGEIRGLGNHLRHAYHVVDLRIVWEIIEDDLPPLEEAYGKAGKNPGWVKVKTATWRLANRERYKLFEKK